jgi:superfamily II DNA or RNA helicase
MRNGKPSANQVQLVKDFLNSPGRTGVIKAKPRAGKTAAVVYLICKLRKQAAIIAHEKLLLNQFYNTFMNFTDVKEVERKTGRRMVVMVKTEKDLASNAPVLLINYQKLISQLGVKRVAKYMSKKRAVIAVDEIHRSSSNRYIELLNRLDPKHKIGVTATDNRKDGLYVLTEETLGHVVAESSVEAMVPKVLLNKTTYKPPRQWRGMRAYNKSVEWLASNKERNIEVIRRVFTDLRKSDLNSIVIPVPGVAHAKLLVRMINKQAAYNNINKDEKWPEPLAEMLWGNLKQDKKEELLDRARSFKIRVVVSISKFVRDGIDVPSWTHMYVLFPGSNVENSFQSTQRICTPYEGKPTPVIRLWHDPVDIMINCCKNTYADSYIPLGYTFGERTKEILDELVNSKKVGKSWVNSNKDLSLGWGSIKDVNIVKTRG